MENCGEPHRACLAAAEPHLCQPDCRRDITLQQALVDDTLASSASPASCSTLPESGQAPPPPTQMHQTLASSPSSIEPLHSACTNRCSCAATCLHCASVPRSRPADHVRKMPRAAHAAPIRLVAVSRAAAPRERIMKRSRRTGLWGSVKTPAPPLPIRQHGAYLLTYLLSHSRGTPLSHPHCPAGQLRSRVVGPEYVGHRWWGQGKRELTSSPGDLQETRCRR